MWLVIRALRTRKGVAPARARVRLRIKGFFEGWADNVNRVCMFEWRMRVRMPANALALCSAVVCVHAVHWCVFVSPATRHATLARGLLTNSLSLSLSLSLALSRAGSLSLTHTFSFSHCLSLCSLSHRFSLAYTPQHPLRGSPRCRRAADERHGGDD